MIRVAIYNIGTGIVDRICACPEDHAERQCRDNEAFFQIFENQRIEDGWNYIEGGVLKRLQAMSVSVTTDHAYVRIDGIPEGAIVTVIGQSVSINNGHIEIDAPSGERLRFRVDPGRPWKPESREVVVP